MGHASGHAEVRRAGEEEMARDHFFNGFRKLAITLLIFAAQSFNYHQMKAEKILRRFRDNKHA